jgi:type II secretory pathway pseudopilin PulG
VRLGNSVNSSASFCEIASSALLAFVRTSARCGRVAAGARVNVPAVDRSFRRISIASSPSQHFISASPAHESAAISCVGERTGSRAREQAQPAATLRHLVCSGRPPRKQAAIAFLARAFNDLQYEFREPQQTFAARSANLSGAWMIRCHRGGVTLIELLVIVSIIGALMGMLLPAVQAARESGRRSQCANNLHNHGLALAAYHASHNRLPPGRYFGAAGPAPRLDYSWAAIVLPWLEQAALAQRIDFQQPWNAPANAAAVATPLGVFRCPSSLVEFPGDVDYGGVLGSAMNTFDRPRAQGDPIFNRGVLVIRDQLRGGVSYGEVTDGLSRTLAVVECADLPPEDHGFWASGVPCVSHDAGSVNDEPEGIFSLHPGGAQALRADGSVAFYSTDVEPLVLGALCTRASDDDHDRSF